MKHWMAALLLVASTAWAAPAGLKSTAMGRGPTLVMIHNLGGNRSMWMPTVRKLLPNYRVVLVDLPGHGDSPMPDPFTLQAGAALIDQVLAEQKPDSTVVVAQGMGAQMALLALEQHPERARGLVAIEMSLKKQFSVPDQQREMFLGFIEQNYDIFLKRTFMPLGRDSLQKIAIHAQAAQVPMPVMKSYIREMIDFDPSENAKTFKKPLLLVVTERLWSVAKDSTSFASTMGYDVLPSYTLRHLTDCGIMVASERPDTLAALIDGFSRQVLAAKTAAK